MDLVMLIRTNLRHLKQAAKRNIR